MNYPLAVVISVGIIALSMVIVKLIEEYFNFKRSYVEQENLKLRKLIDTK